MTRHAWGTDCAGPATFLLGALVGLFVASVLVAGWVWRMGR